ncbi:MAG: VOC family protein [Acidimicrobiia bacterium]
MSVTRLNHAVLYVRDAKKSAEFYMQVLDMEEAASMRGAVFLKSRGTLNDHDLGLFSLGENAPMLPRGAAVGLYHLAWQVDTLGDLVEYEKRLREAGTFLGATDHGLTKSVYGHDIDGIEFELTWVVPSELLNDGDNMKTVRLDINKEIERFGANTKSRDLSN